MRLPHGVRHALSLIISIFERAMPVSFYEGPVDWQMLTFLGKTFQGAPIPRQGQQRPFPQYIAFVVMLMNTDM